MRGLIKHISGGLTLAVALLLLSPLSALAICDGQGVSCGGDGQPLAKAETGLGPNPIFNHQGPGADFVKAGVTTRVGGMTVAQTEPFTLTVPALPPGAVVIETYVSWNYLSNSVPATDIITINGAPFTGSQTGNGSPDVCWGKSYTVNYLVQGATSTINPGPAPVAVTIGGATDKALGTDGSAYGEGLTILVVYEVSDQPWRNVDLYSGVTSTESSGAMGVAAATLNFSVTYVRPDFHFFINAVDGQVAGDDFYIDGIVRSGQIAGTSPAGDAWVGLLGPNANRNFYDHANDDISSFFLPPRNSMAISTSYGMNAMDCIGHTFAGVAFPMSPPEIDAAVDLEPDPMYVYTSYIIAAPPGYAYIGDLSDGYTASQIDPTSILINGAVPPLTTTVLPSYPGFTGEVLEITFALRPFVQPYEPVYDEEVRSYTITGDITAGPQFTGAADFTLIGHLTGDVDFNHMVNISDAVYLLDYVYGNGPAPYRQDVGDVNCDGIVSASDVVYLIKYIFGGGPKPCHH